MTVLEAGCGHKEDTPVLLASARVARVTAAAAVVEAGYSVEAASVVV